MFQADPGSDQRDQPAREGLGQLLLDWVSDLGLLADRLVRTEPSQAASETAQPAAFSTAAGNHPERAAPETGTGVVDGEEHRATACGCLRGELSGEPDAGNLHVRFDEGRGTSVPSYSTGSVMTEAPVDSLAMQANGLLYKALG